MSVRNMNLTVGGQTYACVYDFDTRKLTAEIPDMRQGFEGDVREVSITRTTQDPFGQQMYAQATTLLAADGALTEPPTSSLPPGASPISDEEWDAIGVSNDVPMDDTDDDAPGTPDLQARRFGVPPAPMLQQLQEFQRTATRSAETVIALHRMAVRQLMSLLNAAEADERLMHMGSGLQSDCEDAYNEWRGDA